MKALTVYYAGLVYGEYTIKEYRDMRRSCSKEFYNGAYYKSKHDKTWYRMDGTPVLLVDVPKNLLTLELLLN